MHFKKPILIVMDTQQIARWRGGQNKYGDKHVEPNGLIFVEN